MTTLVKRKTNRPTNFFEELFSDDFQNLFTMVPRSECGTTEFPRQPSFVPRVDVRETEDALIFDAELPRMNEDDVEVTVENNVLTLKGERKLEKHEESESYQRVERHYGSFQRSFTLPSNVNTEDVQANYTDGILEITIAKKAEAKPKKIEIGLNK